MPEERTTLRVPLEDAEKQIQQQLEEGNAIATVDITTVSVLNDRRAEWRTWREYTETLLGHLFSNEDAWRGFRGGRPRMMLIGRSFHEEVRSFRNSCQEDLRKLWSIKQTLGFYVDAERQASAPSVEGRPKGQRVFVVHGHDEHAKGAVARFIEHLQLTAVILHEQPNKGQTLPQKLLANARTADFAVVLLTPDDVGREAGGESREQPRARQNVILELGLFIGLLGPEGVCVLKSADLEAPSDVSGVVYIEFDARGAWKADLLTELQELWPDLHA